MEGKSGFKRNQQGMVGQLRGYRKWGAVRHRGRRNVLALRRESGSCGWRSRTPTRLGEESSPFQPSAL